MTWIPPQYIYLAASALLTLVVLLLRWLGKAMIGKLNKAFETLDQIKTITSVQAENHLKTIQDEAIKQTALMSEMIKESAETNGYLKAVVDMTKPKVA
jgi:DNA topoisomerase IA